MTGEMRERERKYIYFVGKCPLCNENIKAFHINIMIMLCYKLIIKITKK
jgi:hypothetical protein